MGYLAACAKSNTQYSSKNDDFWSLEEELSGRQEPTQVSLALETLDIEVIFANSPQTKGRVVKLFETLQAHLVAEMKLKGIIDINAANTFVNSGNGKLVDVKDSEGNFVKVNNLCWS